MWRTLMGFMTSAACPAFQWAGQSDYLPIVVFAFAGVDDKLIINLEYAKKYNAKCFGVWTIPKKKSIRCGSRDLLERITVKINRHMSHAKASSKETFLNRFDPFRTTDLSIYRAPYTASPVPILGQ